MSSDIHISWQPLLQRFLQSEEGKKLNEFLNRRREEGATIFPPQEEIFNAFSLTPFDHVKVVLLGQDPYHGKGQAHGLCFSVKEGRIPPSLRIIYKELNADLDVDIPSSGDLTRWAENGVLMLNAILTVEEKKAGAHAKEGWEVFTDAVIQELSNEKAGLVFIFWGAFAQKKASLVDGEKHLILSAPHPAAEVYQGGKAGFFGSKPFSKTNDYLETEVWGT